MDQEALYITVWEAAIPPDGVNVYTYIQGLQNGMENSDTLTVNVGRRDWTLIESFAKRTFRFQCFNGPTIASWQFFHVPTAAVRLTANVQLFIGRSARSRASNATPFLLLTGCPCIEFTFCFLLQNLSHPISELEVPAK